VILIFDVRRSGFRIFTVQNRQKLQIGNLRQNLSPLLHNCFQAAGEAPRRPQAYVTYPHILVTLRNALRPDAARIPRKRRIKFLTPSGRGPGPGLRGTVDRYSPDNGRTGTLRLRLKTVSQVQ